MFLRFLAAVVVLLAVLWVVVFAAGRAAVRRAEEAPWPFGLGSIETMRAAPMQFDTSREADQLLGVVNQIDPGDGGVTYVGAQVAKPDDAVDPLPPNIDLAGHEAQLAQFVGLLLASGDRIAWGAAFYSDEDLVDTAALVAATALDRARGGDAGAAWDRLHAIWNLARSLKRAPSTDAKRAALRIERMANAVARKLPAPSPPWAAELSAVEPRRETAAMMQMLAYSHDYDDTAFRGPLVAIQYFFKPLRYYSTAAELRHARLAAEAMASAARCRIDTAALDAAQQGAEQDPAPDVYGAARFEAELEATATVMALKSERARLGKWPAALAGAGASRCGENRWTYTVKPDGAHMTLGMSWEVAAEPGAKAAPALGFAY